MPSKAVKVSAALPKRGRRSRWCSGKAEETNAEKLVGLVHGNFRNLVDRHDGTLRLFRSLAMDAGPMPAGVPGRVSPPRGWGWFLGLDAGGPGGGKIGLGTPGAGNVSTFRLCWEFDVLDRGRFAGRARMDAAENATLAG